MTLKQTLSQARELLVANKIEDASLEAELLLRHTLSLSRTELYLDLNRKLSPRQEKSFWTFIKRRLSGEPTAYITGHRQFYGLEFYINHHVLIPRPESELLVEKSLKLAQNQAVSTIAEIGTGCGAIAISLALNLPQAKIYATDISPAALKVARLNCQEYGLTDRIYLLQGDMLVPLPEPVDLIVANLPYVKKAELRQTSSARFEPQLALNGGPDGLERIGQLCRQLSCKLNPGGYLLLEVGQGQASAVTTLLGNLFPDVKIEVFSDLGGIERVVSLQLNKEAKPALVSAILLAAGQAKRMGRPKQLMPFGGSTILEQAVDNLLHSKVTEAIVVLGYKAKEMTKTLANKSVKIAINPAYQQGMSSSIVTGLNLIDAKTQAVMLALADQPLVDSKTVNRLIDEFGNHKQGIVIPTYQDRRGNPVIFSLKYKRELLGLTGDIGGKQIIEKYPDDILEVVVDSAGINIDIDTINDYQSLLN